MDDQKRWSNISKMYRRILRGEGGEASAAKALYQAAVEAGAFTEATGEILEANLELAPDEIEGLHLLLLEEQHRADEELGNSVK